jgi:hypothetical protein
LGSARSGTEADEETVGPFVLHLASANGPRKPKIGTAQHTVLKPKVAYNNFETNTLRKDDL